MKMYKNQCIADEGKMFVVTQKGYDNSSILRSEGVGNPVDGEAGKWAYRSEVEKGYVKEILIPD